MTVEQAVTLLTRFMEANLFLIGPVLAVAAIIGTITGVLQTATQIQEPSIAYAAKVTGIIVLLALIGPLLIDKMLLYTKSCFEGVATVVR